MDGSGKHECSKNSNTGRAELWEGQRPWDPITDWDAYLLCDVGKRSSLSATASLSVKRGG